MAEKVVLFDLENTLIREWKDVSSYYFEAIRNSYGLSIDDIDLSKYEGMTVQETLIDILSKNGISRDDIYKKHELFLQELPYAHYNVAGHDSAVLVDGAKNLLRHLHSRDYVMGVASGQLEKILRNMFDRAGMHYDSYFKFGTYGDASESFSKILEASIDVAHKEFLSDKHHIYFVSNTKGHVASAHSMGINAIGVITDQFSKKDLENIGMVHVAKSLKDCERILK
ncbi:MAG: HAD family hydrolase [Candidatus Micrarchaeaceae archaeon]